MRIPNTSKLTRPQLLCQWPGSGFRVFTPFHGPFRMLDFSWDAKTASGVYFARLSAAPLEHPELRTVKMRKMMLLH